MNKFTMDSIMAVSTAFEKLIYKLVSYEIHRSTILHFHFIAMLLEKFKYFSENKGTLYCTP